MFGQDCLIRYDKSHFWVKQPMKIKDYTVNEPVIARLLQNDELVLDIGDEVLHKHDWVGHFDDKGKQLSWKDKTLSLKEVGTIYPELRAEALKVVSFLDKEQIPYWIGFQGRGFHLHLFFKGVGVPNKYPELRHFKQAIVQWVIDNTGADCCLDVNNKNAVMIRAFGSTHEKCFFKAVKCCLNIVPEEYPINEVQSDETNYPLIKNYWQIPTELINQFLSVKPVVRKNTYWKKENDSVSKFEYLLKLKQARRLLHG